MRNDSAEQPINCSSTLFLLALSPDIVTETLSGLRRIHQEPNGVLTYEIIGP